MRLSRSLVIVLALPASLALCTSSAMGVAFGPAAGMPYADNAEHTFCFNNLTDKTLNAAQNARDTLDETTDLYKNMFCGAATDAQVYDGQYGSAADWGYGKWTCTDPNGDVCESADIKINIQPPVMDEQAKRRKTTCHEFGHSIGLDHYGSNGDGHAGCMVSGHPSEANNYNSHELDDHVNPHY